jgi:hypothetical protein
MIISRRTFGVARILMAALVLGISESNAIELKNASYFCTVEFAGGLAFNDTSKNWESVKFRPDNKFVLKLQFVSKRLQKNMISEKDEPVADFNATLTKAGTSEGHPCFSQDSGQTLSMTGDFDYLSCDYFPSEYQFNLKNNRFLTYYKFGYLNGTDNNDNTPAVSGGTCTKID